MPDQAVGEAHDAVGDAAIQHQLTREDEEGDGEEAEDLHAADHLLEDDGHGQAGRDDGGHRRQPDRERDRHAQQQQQREAHAEDSQFHEGVTSVPRSSARMCSIENSTISTPAMTTGT